MKATAPAERRTGFSFLFIFLVLAAGILATGVFYYRSFEHRFRTQIEQQLSAVAELKANELMQWRAERLGDAESLFNNAAFCALVRRFLTNPKDKDSYSQLQSWLRAIQAAFKYDRLFLLDTKGTERLHVPDIPETVASHLAMDVDQALRLHRIIFVDFHRDVPGGPVHLSVIVPLRDLSGSKHPLGVLVLRTDPSVGLYPMINRWPTPSRTAETLIVRRDGDNALFLNNLRFAPDSALNLRIPTGKRDTPAVMAVLGQVGVVDGHDYRGEPVLAALRPIEGSPWYIIARMDTKEAFAPLRERQWMTVLFVGALILGAGGSVGLLWRHQRVSFYKERLAIAEALRESEERFRTLFEQAAVGVALVDPAASRFVRINQKYCDLLGYTQEEAGQINFYSITHPDDLAATRANMEQLSFGEIREFTMEKRYLRKDGSMVWVHLTVSSLKSREGAPIYAISVARDITTEKFSVEELRASEERLRRTVMDSPFPILLHAQNGAIIHASDSLYEITGYTREELATVADWTERAHGARKEEVQADIDAFFGLDKRKAEGEYSIRTKSGATRIWDFSSVPVGRLPDGRRLALSMAMDVTERRESENEVRRLNAELDKRVKDRTSQLEAANQELEAFSYSVSHDLRAPLRAIDGFARILATEQGESLDKPGRRYLDIICSEAKRMGQLIDDLLSFSQMARLPLRAIEVDMRALAQSVYDECAAQVNGRKIHLILKPLPLAFGDPAMLRQVMVNLMGNAIKFTGFEALPEIEIGGSADGDMNCFFIKDNGVGFDMRYVDKLFGVFQRLHSEAEFEGTGVGLALAQRVIHRHGGRIWAEGKVNEGAAFHFTLPAGKEFA
jgi:PAS domain S-box-containing protein